MMVSGLTPKSKGSIGHVASIVGRRYRGDVIVPLSVHALSYLYKGRVN